MAAITAWVPRRMTGNAAHLGIAVSTAAATLGRQIAPDHVAVLLEAHRLGQGRLLVVIRMQRIDDVDDLLYLPAQVFLDTGVLEDLIAAALEAWPAGGGSQGFEVATAIGSRGVCC